MTARPFRWLRPPEVAHATRNPDAEVHDYEQARDAGWASLVLPETETHIGRGRLKIWTGGGAYGNHRAVLDEFEMGEMEPRRTDEALLVTEDGGGRYRVVVVEYEPVPGGGDVVTLDWVDEQLPEAVVSD